MNISEFYNILQHIPIFERLSPEQTEKIKNNSSLKQYDKGDLLFSNGQKSTHIYVIISGWVKLCRTTYDGKEAVLNLLTDGDIVGWGDLDQSYYTLSAEIVGQTQILQISKDQFKQMLLNDADLSLKIILSLNYALRKFELKTEHMNTMTAPQRIGCFIIKLSGDITKGSVGITLPFDKMLIASYLCMKRETFSRALNTLKARGISVQGNKIHIKEISEIIKYSCASCSLFDKNQY